MYNRQRWFSGDKITVSIGDTVEVIRWCNGRFHPLCYYIWLKVVCVDYKNPRARIKMVTLNGKKEFLIYPRNIIRTA